MKKFLVLPHEAQIACERAKTAGAKVESLTVQLQLAKIANGVAQKFWEQAALAGGVQDGDLVTDDYRVQRGGAYVEAPVPAAPAQALDDTTKSTNGAAIEAVS